MNRFTTALCMRKVSYDASGRPIFELLEDLVYESDRFGRHVMEKGRRTNLCSTPRLPVVYLVAGEIEEEPSALHDDKYTRHDVSKEVADLLFLEMMAAPKLLEAQKITPAWKRWAMYQAVKHFGQSSWDMPTTVWQPPAPTIFDAAALEAP